MLLSTMWAARWARTIAAVIAGAILYATFFSSFGLDETTTSWWRPGHQRNDTVVGDPGTEIEDTEPPKEEQAGIPSSSVAVDWSQFAYTQYATDSDYLCNSVMLFEILHRLGSLPDRVLMYPSRMMEDVTLKDPKNDNQRLLRKAADTYGVKLVPIEVQHRNGHDGKVPNQSYAWCLG